MEVRSESGPKGKVIKDVITPTDYAMQLHH